MLYSTHSSEISQKPWCTASKLTPVQAEPTHTKIRTSQSTSQNLSQNLEDIVQY